MKNIDKEYNFMDILVLLINSAFTSYVIEDSIEEVDIPLCISKYMNYMKLKKKLKY